MGVLNDRVALVTGAGRGIGAAIAEGLAAEGAGVVVNDLGVDLEGGGSNAGPAKEVADGIVAKGGTAIHDNTNVTDFDGCEGMIQRTVEEFGRLDILVNVAGIVRDGMIFKMTEQQWDSVIDVHLKGTFNTTRHASTHWRENRGGQFRLINFVSGSGLFGAPAQPNYAAAKMGIIGMSKIIAMDMQRYNVRSNCISPFAWSRLIGTIPTETEEQARRVEKLKEMGPDRIAPLAVYLASDLSKDVSGQIFGSRMNELFLFSQNRPIRSAHRDGGWTPQTIADHGMPALKPSMYPLERSSDVIGWEPV